MTAMASVTHIVGLDDVFPLPGDVIFVRFGHPGTYWTGVGIIVASGDRIHMFSYVGGAGHGNMSTCKAVDAQDRRRTYGEIAHISGWLPESFVVRHREHWT